jgi:acyl carrier protein
MLPEEGIVRPVQGPSVALLETTLSGIWSELLGVDTVGPQDNFFELGGNSMLAGEVVTRLRATLGIDMPLKFLFESETLDDLVRLFKDQTLPL